MVRMQARSTRMRIMQSRLQVQPTPLLYTFERKGKGLAACAEDIIRKRVLVGLVPEAPRLKSRNFRHDRHMRRYGNLYEKICGYENLLIAAENARKGKGRQGTVKDFYRDFEANIRQLHAELLSHTFKTSAYSIFTVYEPKERVIYRLPFRGLTANGQPLSVTYPAVASNIGQALYVQ